MVALVGAWVGHFLEFVRVAGWHAGLVDMTSSVHTYFFPAGAGLMVVGLAATAGISKYMYRDGSSACGFAMRKRAMDPRRRE